MHGGRVDLVERMRRAGLRLTGPRRAIARVLEQADDHLDIDQITKRARKADPSVHRATVYRTVGILKKIGMVDELDLLHIRGDRHYYEIRIGSEHAHVICTTCGEVVEPSGKTISRARDGFAGETGYRVDYIRVEVGGTCPRCLSTGGGERRAAEPDA
ncbi:MAG: transcriptional repressor [Acidobacteriota bacterium]|nr:transcriptional repressor [Acidobacteriota bacterium]